MQLACEPAPLELLPLNHPPQRVARHALGEIDGNGCAGRELLGDPQVVVAEAWVLGRLVMRDEHAGRQAPNDEWHKEPGARPEAARRVLVDLGIVEQLVDALAATALEHAARLRRRLRERPAGVLCAFLAGRSLDAQHAPGNGKRDQHEPRVDQVAEARGDEAEEPVDVELADQRGADPVQRARAGATNA